MTKRLKNLIFLERGADLPLFVKRGWGDLGMRRANRVSLPY
jgi:hypothetical protein